MRLTTKLLAAGALRSGASGLWTPASATTDGAVTTALWMRADDHAGSDGSAVELWTSREGNSYAFAQATGTKQPILKTGANGINGENVVRFDGSNDLLVYPAGDISTAAEGTVFAVYRMTATIKLYQVLFSSNDEAVTTKFLFCNAYEDGTFPGPSIVQRNAEANADNVASATVTMVASTPYAVTWRGGASYAIRVNGTPQALTVRDGTNSGDWFSDTTDRDNFVIGGLKRTTETQWFKGDLAELIVYNSALSTADIEQVEGYLSTRYDLGL